MGEISAASQEQSAGIEQVHHTVTQMDEATQQNAALVEEAAAAAASLEDQAARLAQVVSVFRLDEAVARRATASAPAKRPAARPAIAAAAPRPSALSAKSPVRQTAKAADDWEEF
jgi:methyl-accepting chemotaxis protein